MIRFSSVVTVALAASLALPAAGLAQSPGKPTVSVVPVAGKGGPKLDPQLRQLEAALKSQVTVVPFKAFQKAAKKMKVKPKDLATITGAAGVGRELKLTHVVLVEGSTEKIGEGKKKKAVSSAKMTAIALENGDTVFTQSYVLKGKKLTKDIATQMSSDLVSHLAAATPVATPTPVAETEAAPPSPPTPPGEQPGAAPAAVGDATAAASPATLPTDGTPAAGTTPEATASAEGAPPAEPAPSAEPAPAMATEPVTEPTDAGGKAPRWRPGLTVRLGALGFSRKAEISDSSASQPLTYSGDSKLPTAAGILQLEFYPLALRGRGAWYEGLGLDGEGTFTQVPSKMQSGTTTTTSTVYSGRGGLSLRFVLWDSEKAADVKVRAGYGLLKFPLDSTTVTFPGASFSGPYAGLTFDFPIVKTLAITLGGTYTPKLTVADEASKLGASVSSASAFVAEAGLRLVFAPIEIGLIGRMEKFSATYSGASQLATAAYTNAKLDDTYTGGLLTVGMQL